MNLNNILQQKNMNIETYENEFWGDAPEDVSGLEKSCYYIRKKDIIELDDNELRIAISQNMGLDLIVPIVISKIEKNPFVEALYYKGDLLKSLLEIDKSYWRKNKTFHSKVLKIVRDFSNYIDSENLTSEIKDELKKVSSEFLNG